MNKAFVSVKGGVMNISTMTEEEEEEYMSISSYSEAVESFGFSGL